MLRRNRNKNRRFWRWYHECQNRAAQALCSVSGAGTPLRRRANGYKERCPYEAVTSSGRVKLRTAIDIRQFSASSTLEEMGCLRFSCSHHEWNPPHGRCRAADICVRHGWLVASHPALHRGWARLVARDLVMRAEVYRDSAGFWMARIEEDANAPESKGIGTVCRCQALPVTPSASRAEAEAALRRVMSREARCPNGHR